MNQDLSKLTDRQAEIIVTHLSKSTLPTLRKRQRIIDSQLERAHGLPPTPWNLKGVSNLNIMRRHTDAAINLKCFG